MDEESNGQTLLPVNFLRQLIALYGDSMQSMVPQYLEASMEAFRRNQLQFRSAMEGAFSGGPFAEIAKRNMAMFEAAATAFKPGTQAVRGGTRRGAAARPRRATRSPRSRRSSPACRTRSTRWANKRGPPAAAPAHPIA